MVIPENTVGLDLDDGGRWTSLILGGREWFWTGPHRGNRNGLTSYVDAGGLDECFPTVRGTPDHGSLWNQPWGVVDKADEWDVVELEDALFLRRVNGGEAPDELGPHSMWADYRLLAAPGYRFIWAAHALLDCEVGARIVVPAGTVARLHPEAFELLGEFSSEPWVDRVWPTSLDLASYGPDDGTAVGAVLVDCPAASVVDRGQTLTLAVSCPGQPVSIALWRNLGGFPASSPYRSLGVEPMLGRAFDLADAGPSDTAVVGPSGEVNWRLTLSVE
ncbi:hypothetical protein OG394_36680 [Kribbella sp. NBC_01245]|uniref:hypothetical protein n=1 Tax=Kribbella sp. NBC_01245 TaxID=2903578 RepID=UPI002E297E82|nr:hypothetical protein [Kribbella sp. NBC_01245]